MALGGSFLVLAILLGGGSYTVGEAVNFLLNGATFVRTRPCGVSSRAEYVGFTH